MMTQVEAIALVRRIYRFTLKDSIAAVNLAIELAREAKGEYVHLEGTAHLRCVLLGKYDSPRFEEIHLGY